MADERERPRVSCSGLHSASSGARASTRDDVSDFVSHHRRVGFGPKPFLERVARRGLVLVARDRDQRPGQVNDRHSGDTGSSVFVPPGQSADHHAVATTAGRQKASNPCVSSGRDV